MSGNCYQMALRMATRHEAHGAVVVHGRPVYRGSELIDDPEGRYDHAWAEVNGMVLDYSNGNEVELPAPMYYRVGEIQQQNCKRYTVQAAHEHMMEFGHYGPWVQS